MPAPIELAPKSMSVGGNFYPKVVGREHFRRDNINIDNTTTINNNNIEPRNNSNNNRRRCSTIAR